MTGENRVRDMTEIALFAILIAVCAWISIPMVIPFTLQSLGVFLAIHVLGGKKGTAAVGLYLLLGLIGIPVFSGFRGGIGVLLGYTGGYLIGFLFTALVMWGMEHLFGRKSRIQVISMGIGLLIHYTFGTMWYIIVYAAQTKEAGLTAILGWCVFPFVIPDLVKLWLALILGKRLRKVLPV